jgi:hypothetical protein
MASKNVNRFSARPKEARLLVVKPVSAIAFKKNGDRNGTASPQRSSVVRRTTGGTCSPIASPELFRAGHAHGGVPALMSLLH